MAIFGRMRPKLIPKMMAIAVMPSATVSPKSCKVGFGPLANCRRPLAILTSVVRAS
jgi:hypothetical protein